MKKRLLSILLALCVLSALLPARALAAEIDPEDTGPVPPLEAVAGAEDTKELPPDGPEGPAETGDDPVLFGGGPPTYDTVYPVEGGNLYFNSSSGGIIDCDSSVTGAEIPGSINDVTVTSIGERAFQYCRSLSSVTIPGSVSSIGGNAFYGCSSLNSVTIPGSVTSIGGNAFYGCSSLSSVTISSGVTSIGDNAFRSCSSLSSITIPDSVTFIGKEAFSGCSNLSSIEVDLANPVYTSVNGVLFGGRSSYLRCYPAGKTDISYSIPDSVSIIDTGAFSGCSNLSSVTIPGSVTDIFVFAFFGCSSLNSITIPGSVTSIDSNAFDGCSSLSSIEVDLENAQYSSVNGILFNKSKTELLRYPAGKATTSYSIPSSVASIHHGAFFGCSSLSSVTIPDSVTDIGNGAFDGCSLADVYYKGTESQWNAISIGDDNDPLISAEIHYNSVTPTPGPTPTPGGEKVPVHSEDTDNVLDTALSQADFSNLLANVTSHMEKLRGPEVEIAGKKFHIFEIDSKLELPFEHVPIEASIDHEKKTLNLLIGFKIKGDATISRDPNSLIKDDYESGTEKYWSAYRDAKDLVKLISGKDASNKAFLNKYRRIDQKLKKFDMDMIVKASGQVAGYLELSYETGQLKFSEGGALLAVEAKKTLNGRLPSFSAAYVTLRFEVSAKGKLRLVVDEENSQTIPAYRFDPAFAAELAAAIGVGLGKNTGKFQGYIEGGFDGALNAELRPFQAVTDGDPFTVDMTGNLYFDWKLKAWLWEIGDPYKKKLFKLGLYPRLELLSAWDGAPLTMDDFLASAEPVTRDYLYSPVLMDIRDDYSFARIEYPYAEPALLRLRDGRRLMVWVGDSGRKADADRTSVFYSVYSGGAWSQPAAIYESGTYADHPVLCQDGGAVYAVWMQADSELDGMEAHEALAHLDLMFSVFDGGGWSIPVCISEPNNGLAETDYALAAKDGTVSVAWIENSENDMLMGSGRNMICLRTYENGAWAKESEVYSTNEQITGLDIDCGNGVQLAWSVTDSDGTTTSYRQDAGGNPELSAGTDQAARWINGSLYELRDTALYRDGVATGLSGLTNYEIVFSDTQTAVLTLIPSGFACELYGSYYDAGREAWGPWVQLTSFDKYIRSYSAVLDESGKLVAAVNLVNVDADAEKVYDNTSAMLAVVDDCSYTDLAVEDWLAYDDAAVVPGGILPLTFNAANHSMETLTSITADVNGQRQVIPCHLNAGESGVFTANYRLPTELSAHEVRLTVTPGYVEEESNTGNNIASARIGLADLATAVSAPELSGSGAFVKIHVDNKGYADAENAVLTVYQSNLEGKILHTANLGTIAAGRTAECVYQLPAGLLLVDDPETMNALCCEVISKSEERELANNVDRIVFDNLHPQQAGATMDVHATVGADAVQFSVTIENAANDVSNSLLILSLYGENGKMLAVESRTLPTVAAGESTKVEVNIDRDQYLDAARAQVVWLDDLCTPMTPAWKGEYPTK